MVNLLLLIGVKSKSPEEKRKERIKNKAERLYYELETENQLTIDEKVDALIQFTRKFKARKRIEIKQLNNRRKEIEDAMDKLI